MNASTASDLRPSPGAPRRRTSAWVTVALVGLVLGALMVLALVGLFNGLHLPPMHVTINGTPVASDINLAGMPPAHKVALAVAILVMLLVALVIVPIALLLGAIAILCVVVFAVGLPVLVLTLVFGVLLSPLWLLLWMLWRATRSKPAAASPTIAA